MHKEIVFNNSNLKFFGTEEDDKAPKAKGKISDLEQKRHEHWNRRYPSNKIKTTRYNIFNFIPITFLLQFTKVINVFYLFNMILQSIPEVSTNDWFYTLIPLSAMVSLGMVKEFVGEYKRWKEDKQSNAMPALVLNGNLNKATEDSRQRKRESDYDNYIKININRPISNTSINSPSKVNISLDKTLKLPDHYRLDTN